MASSSNACVDAKESTLNTYYDVLLPVNNLLLVLKHPYFNADCGDI